MIKNYIKTALRIMLRQKGYSAINVIGLSMGIAATLIIIVYIVDELGYDKMHADAEKIYRVCFSGRLQGNEFVAATTSAPMAEAIQREIPDVKEVVRFGLWRTMPMGVGDKHFTEKKFLLADSNFFHFFSFPVIAGNPETFLKGTNKIVITESVAKRYFGNENPIGKIMLRGAEQTADEVTGVVKDPPYNSHIQFDIVLSSESWDYMKSNTQWTSNNLYTYIKLNDGGKIDNVNRLLDGMVEKYMGSELEKFLGLSFKEFKQQGNNVGLFTQWLPGIHLTSNLREEITPNGNIQYLYIFGAIAIFIVLIACINFMNLTTARSATRAKEVGIRKVLGAERRSLVIQFIGEALSMSVMAAILSMGILKLTLPLFNQLIQKQLLLQFDNPVHITALLIITILCGLIAGSYPSFYLSSFNPVSVLKGLKIKTGSAAFIRQGLVVLQFTISIVFIISTIIIYLQIQHVKNRQLGFNKNNLIEINMQHDVSAMFPVVKQDLFATGVIENTTMAGHPIIYGGDSDEGFNWQGKSAESKVSVHFRKVSSEFVATTGMQIVQGKDFDANLPSANKVIINQTLANLIDKNNAVGKIIQSPRGQKEGEYKNYTVVGVVKDYMYGNMYGKANPTLLFCEPPDYNYLIYIRVKPQGDISKALSAIETVLKKDNPVYPFEYKFVDDQFNNMFINETLMSNLSGVFAVLAIIISCLGLFGLAAYTAERRLKEISIRKVLGANAFGIAGLLSKDFLQLVGIACLIAFPAAWWIMHNWLQSYEYRIQISWWIFFIAGLFAVVIALVTVSFQSIKAALVNPVKNLRSE